MFCSKCGSELPDGCSFCPNCGKPVNCIKAAHTSSVNSTFTSNSNIDIIASVLGNSFIILGCFLPFLSVHILTFEKNLSLIDAGGPLIAAFSALCLIFFLLKKQLVALIPFGFTIGTNIYMLKKTADALHSEPNIDVSNFINCKIGAYLYFLGIIIMIVSFVIYFYNVKKHDQKLSFAAQKIILTVTFVICCLLVFGYRYAKPYIQNENKYRQATEYFNDKDYSSALDLYTSIGSYKDSDNLASQCKYALADADKTSGNYEIAANKFAELGNFSDSKDKENECIYLLATDYYNKGLYEYAKESFESISNYKDSNTMIDNCDDQLAQESEILPPFVFDEPKSQPHDESGQKASTSENSKAADTAKSIEYGITDDNGNITKPCYTLTFPESWSGKYVVNSRIINDFFDTEFCEKLSVDTGYNGTLFSISLMPTSDDYTSFPSYDYIGTITVSGVGDFNVIATYPTDVCFNTFNKDASDQYSAMQEDVKQIIGTFKPTKNAAFAR